MKKKLSVLLALLMVATLLTSCSGLLGGKTAEESGEAQSWEDIVFSDNSGDSTAEVTDEVSEAEPEQACPEADFLGVWECTSYPDSYYNRYTLCFSEIDGKYMGSYTVATTYDYTESVYMSHRAVFEYAVKDGMLEIVTDKGVTKSEEFTLKNDILTYQGLSYTKLDYLESFGAAPDEKDYELLLKGSMDFVESERYVTVYTLSGSDNYHGIPCEYAMVDMDADGIKELLIQYDGNGDTAILHWEYGLWVAYYAPYRGILDLKTDGTMYGSGGAATGSVHRYIFKEGQMITVDLYEYDESGTPYYYVDGFACDKEFMEQRAQEINQNDKQSVVWLNIP
ncbi:MAG: hypothetical protein IKT46_02465 [Clostridia bacterium]|nr:hypothetical protein [Clostridia bacterium]